MNCGRMEMYTNRELRNNAFAHLQELHHRPGHARYTFADGEKAKQVSEKLGSPAVVPAWGERLV